MVKEGTAAKEYCMQAVEQVSMKACKCKAFSKICEDLLSTLELVCPAEGRDQEHC